MNGAGTGVQMSPIAQALSRGAAASPAPVPASGKGGGMAQAGPVAQQFIPPAPAAAPQPGAGTWLAPRTAPPGYTPASAFPGVSYQAPPPPPAPPVPASTQTSSVFSGRSPGESLGRLFAGRIPLNDGNG